MSDITANVPAWPSTVEETIEHAPDAPTDFSTVISVQPAPAATTIPDSFVKAVANGLSAGTSGAVALPSAAQKYVTAFILFASVAITPFSTLFVAGFSWTTLWQFVALLSGAVVSYLIPLAPRGWRGVGKTLAMTVAAVATAIIPVWQNDWNAASIFALITAVVTAVGTELGVQFRTDQNVSTTVNPA